MIEPNTRIQNAITRINALSPRELDVARLVCSGASSKLIAHELGIAIKTVERHRERILEKTGCGSLVEFARLWEARLAEIDGLMHAKFQGVPRISATSLTAGRA